MRTGIPALILATGLSVLAALIFAPSAESAPSFVPLGDLPGGHTGSSATGISADGSTVVGLSQGSLGPEPFRWTDTGGIVGLGLGPFAGATAGRATSTSADGSVVVGFVTKRGIPEGFRWTAESGMVGLTGGAFLSDALGVSADGSVVVGNLIPLDAYRWTSETGPVGLGTLPPYTDSQANGVSADGSVIVGQLRSSSAGEAFRWTADTRMVGLGSLPGWSGSTARAASADGSVVVGESFHVAGDDQAFRWNAETGMIGLGDLPGGPFQSDALSTSADGSVVVGRATSALGDEAFIWDATNGMRNLHQVLTDAGLDLTGWRLSEATSVSADGLAIVGNGHNPNGQLESWLARLAGPVLSVRLDCPNNRVDFTVFNPGPESLTNCTLTPRIAYSPSCDAPGCTAFRPVLPNGTAEDQHVLIRDPNDPNALPQNPLPVPLPVLPGETPIATASIPFVNDRDVTINAELSCDGMPSPITIQGSSASCACPDTDSDALCDVWETNGGIDLNGDGKATASSTAPTPEIDLLFPKHWHVEKTSTGTTGTWRNLRPDRKSMLVEMDAFTPAMDLDLVALYLVTRAFEEVEIEIAFDETEYVAAADQPPTGVAFSGPDDFNRIKLGPSPDSDPGTGYRGNHRERAAANNGQLRESRNFAFRYVLSGDFISGAGQGCLNAPPSGVADLLGDDVLLGMSNRLTASAPHHLIGDPRFIATPWFQWLEPTLGGSAAFAAVLAHELGHTLGLRHGGDDHLQYKPNYLSLMSYARLYHFNAPGRRLSFSRWNVADLDKDGLDERAGLFLFPKPDDPNQQIRVPIAEACTPDAESCTIAFASTQPLCTDQGGCDDPDAYAQRVESPLGGPIDWDGSGAISQSLVSNQQLELHGGSSAADACLTRQAISELACSEQLELLRAVGSVTSHDDTVVMLPALKNRASPHFRLRSPLPAGCLAITELPDEDILQFAVGQDSDRDGIPNLADTCPSISNPLQEDIDGDGVGDRCQPPLGDFDLDLDVDGDDLPYLTGAFGLTTSHPRFAPIFDLDGDGAVTFVDYQIWLDAERKFRTGSTPSSVAASGGCGLGTVETVAVLGILIRLRRRRSV